MRAAEFLSDVKETLEWRGEDIDAACGQLAAKDLRGHPAVLSC
jgi:adenine C2-methylase RlmN of 23S rRNA A2503 and tRNA A37